MKNEIVYIPIEKIHPHPDNPRKNIGDITELTESVKMDGVMQNLTVVPNKDIDGEYTLVIGHRRCAAAKAAGLTELPCIISDMDYKKQVSTMLVENIQRSDLTVIEQADGFQMMIDLGDSIEDVVEKTGFSEATVRRRLKIAELDRKETIKAYERGGTLADFAALEKVKKKSDKKELLKLIGTRDFDYGLKRILREQIIEKNKKPFEKLVKKYGIKQAPSNALWSDEYKSSKTEIDLATEYEKFDEGLLPKDYSKKQYYYYITYSDIVRFYTHHKKETKKVAVKKSEQEIEAEKALAELNKKSKLAYECRRDFVLSLKNNTNSPKGWREICFNALLEKPLFCSGIYDDKTGIFKALEIEFNPDYYNYEAFKENVQKYRTKRNEAPAGASILIVYTLFDDSLSQRYYDNCVYKDKPRHRKNRKLDFIYEFLGKLGYQMSDEEIALQNGTDENFYKEVSADE